MKHITLTELVICSLAAWRYAEAIRNDYILQTPKQKLVNLIENWALKNPRQYKLSISHHIDYLAYCIYCLTLYMSIIIYNMIPSIVNIGAIWAISTLIGITHQQLTEQKTDTNKIE